MLRFKSKKRVIGLEDIHDAIHLMDAGFSFVEALEIIKNPQNKKTFEEIVAHLENGEDSIVFMREYFSSDMAFYFLCFASFMPFLPSLKMAYTIITQQKQTRDSFIKSLIYPFVLLMSTILGIVIFDRTILPNLLMMMRSFQNDMRQQMYLTKIFELLSLSFCVLIVLALTTLAILLHPKNIVSTYKFFAKAIPDALIVQYASLQFARIFKACVSVKLSTKQILHLMKNITAKPMVPFLAGEIEKSLSDGNTLHKAISSTYVEQKLIKFFHLSMKEGDIEEMLEAYIQLSLEREKKRIKRLTSAIQLVAYGWIGMLLAVVYQVLMMPLQVLQNIG